MQYSHVGISYFILRCLHLVIFASTSQNFHWFFGKPCNTHIIIIKLHFAMLPPCDTCIHVLKCPLLYELIMQYLHIHMFSQFKIHLYVNITCVMSNMRFWYNTNVVITFGGQGST